MKTVSDAKASTVNRRITGALIWLIFSQLFMLISLSPWYLLARMSTMLFDFGSSTQSAIIAGLIWGYPLLPLGGAILAWVLYVRQKTRPALIATSLPLLVACPLSIFVFILLASA